MRQPTMYRRENVWDFMSDVEKAFDELWRQPGSTTSTADIAPRFTPPVDLHESDDGYLISVDLPGVNEKDIKIDVSNGRLSISGERTHERREEGKGFRRFERAHGRFERAFQLPQDVNQEKIQARFENGVLEVLVPKTEVAKPRSIQVETQKGGLFSKLIAEKH